MTTSVINSEFWIYSLARQQTQAGNKATDWFTEAEEAGVGRSVCSAHMMWR